MMSAGQSNALRTVADRRGDTVEVVERVGEVPGVEERLLFDIGEQVHEHGVSGGRAGQEFHLSRREHARGLFVIVSGKGELLKVVGACDPPRRSAGGLNRREQECDQDGDDCDDYEQFDQGKPAMRTKRSEGMGADLSAGSGVRVQLRPSGTWPVADGLRAARPDARGRSIGTEARRAGLLAFGS